MDSEIEVKVKYGWLHWRGHAKMYASAKYHCCRTNSYWETDLKEKLKTVTGQWNIGHKWPSAKLHLEIIETNILSKIHNDHFKNVTSRVLTRFSFDLALWPSYWLHVTKFWSWPRNHLDEHFEQHSWWLLKKCDLWNVNKVFLWSGLVI